MLGAIAREMAEEEYYWRALYPPLDGKRVLPYCFRVATSQLEERDFEVINLMVYGYGMMIDSKRDC